MPNLLHILRTRLAEAESAGGVAPQAERSEQTHDTRRAFGSTRTPAFCIYEPPYHAGANTAANLRALHSVAGTIMPSYTESPLPVKRLIVETVVAPGVDPAHMSE